jgi:TrpR family trp operon transcriptional repressor
MEDKEKVMADSMEELSQTLASVNDSVLLKDFLKALLTPQEYNAVAARWALVRLLDQGMTQRKIAETLGLSLCKITRGSREMKKEESSFRKMIDICKKL